MLDIEIVNRVFPSLSSSLPREPSSCDDIWELSKTGGWIDAIAYVKSASQSQIMYVGTPPMCASSSSNVPRLWCYRKRMALPQNAEEIGSHYFKSKEAMSKFGINLSLAIGCPLFWSDNDIAKTWLAAANGDHEQLLGWLLNSNKNYYICKTRIPEDRLKRIIKLIKERNVV